MATGFATPCHLHFFVTMLHFFYTAITWQVELTQHGNCISCDMATTIHLDGNSAQLHGNCSCHDVATVVAPHMSISPLFFYLHLTSYTLFPHNPSVFWLSPYPNTLFIFWIIAGTPEEISPSLDEAYRKIEEAALQRRTSRGQGQSSSNLPAETASEDTIRSATPGSVRQQRVVHPPPVEDYEPEFRATKEQTQLYDIIKRFGNVRASSKHMKELKA